MRRFWMFFLFCLLSSLGLAQPAQPAAPEPPPIEAYFEIFDYISFSYSRGISYEFEERSLLTLTINYELTRYYNWDEIAALSFPTLDKMHTYFLGSGVFDVPYNTYLLTLVIEAGFREGVIDFTAPLIPLQSVNLHLTPVDLDGDSVTEHLVRLEGACSDQHLPFGVIDFTDNNTLVIHQLPYNNDIFCTLGWSVSDIFVDRVEDVNGDGLVEWVYAIYTTGVYGGGTGYFDVMSYNGETLTDLSDGFFSTSYEFNRMPQWTFTPQENGTVMIEMEYEHTGVSYRCVESVHKTWQWVDGAANMREEAVLLEGESCSLPEPQYTLTPSPTSTPAPTPTPSALDEGECVEDINLNYDPISLEYAIRFANRDLETNPRIVIRQMTLYMCFVDMPNRPYYSQAFRYWRALAWRYAGDPVRAIADYEAVIALNPESPWATLANIHLDYLNP